MRILHTSDWHLGRQFFNAAFDEDHDHVLAQVETAIATHEPDLLIIAGDIFDRASPPQAALSRLGAFLRRVAATQTAIVIIAGNHDAAAQIGMLGVLAPSDRTLVRGPLDPDDHPLLLTDEHGDVAISALPFSYEYAARACFQNDAIVCPADVLRTQLDAARRHVPANARWVVVAHSFVEGSATSNSERSLSRTMGGIETVPADLFAGAHYVALGHLHRAQAAGAAHIRYSGAPLAFGFDEEGQQKSLTLVDLGPDGATFTELPLTPLRQVRTLRGRLAELLAAPVGSNDFINVILTDDVPQIEPMKRIRKLYPSAVQLSYERHARPLEERLNEGRAAIDAPDALVAAFIDFVRDEPLSPPERALVDDMLGTLNREEEA